MGKAEDQVLRVRKDQVRWDRARALSLPADPDVARVEYSKRVSEMVKEAGFSPDTVVKTADVAAAPMAGPASRAAKPALTKISCKIAARAERAAVVKFLEAFYKTPLLHQVRTMTLRRAPTTGAGGQVRPGELIVLIGLEAAIVDTAEQREGLMPRVPLDAAQL